MNAMKVVLTDLAVLSVLMMIGVTLRKKCGFLQRLYLPASLLAGIVGLILGPQVLGHYAGWSLPIGKTIAQWPGQLTSIVLGLAFVGTESSSGFGKIAAGADWGTWFQTIWSIVLVVLAIILAITAFKTLADQGKKKA